MQMQTNSEAFCKKNNLSHYCGLIFFFFSEGLQANVEEKRVKGSLIDGRKT